MSLTLDVNFDVYPLAAGDRITVLLASTLHGDDDKAGEEGSDQDRREAWRGGDQGLAADFDYVTYGKARRTLAPYLLCSVVG